MARYHAMRNPWQRPNKGSHDNTTGGKPSTNGTFGQRGAMESKKNKAVEATEVSNGQLEGEPRVNQAKIVDGSGTSLLPTKVGIADASSSSDAKSKEKDSVPKKRPPAGTVTPEIDERSRISLAKGLVPGELNPSTADTSTVPKRSETTPLNDARIANAPTHSQKSGAIKPLHANIAERNDRSKIVSDKTSQHLTAQTLGINLEPNLVPASAATSDVESSERLVTKDVATGFKSVSWTQVTGSYRRERAIEGLLFGVAVGDALGLARDGLSRRAAISMFGKSRLSYRMLPGLGVVSDDTHRMFMTMQSILRSKSQIELFRNAFAYRLKFYLATFPATAGWATILSATRLWLGVAPEDAGCDSGNGDALVSGLALATVLQGTGHSVERWVTASAVITHANNEAIEASILISHTAHMALMIPVGRLNPLATLDQLIELTDHSIILQMLKTVRRSMEAGDSVHRAARLLKFRRGVPNAAAATAVMSVYAWLRHSHSFEDAVSSAIRLGGSTDTMGGIVGGFAGIHLGTKGIPRDWLKRVSTWPQSTKWIEKLTARLTDWPHGSEDLHAAPALPSYPVRQFARSIFLSMGLVLGALIQLPWKIWTWIGR